MTYLKIYKVESHMSKLAKLWLLELSRYNLCVHSVKVSALEREPLLQSAGFQVFILIVKSAKGRNMAEGCWL